MSNLIFNSVATPAAPVAGKTKVYTKADNLLYAMGPDGIERSLMSPGVIPANSVLSMFRNRLINGGMNINQRGVGVVAGNSWAHNAYCMDRWYVQTETTSSSNVTAQQLLDPESIQTECLRLTQPDLLAKRIGVVQIIEGVNCRHMKGGAFTLSGRIRSSLAQNIKFAVLSNTGTQDTVTHNLINSWSSNNYTAANFFTAAIGTPTAIGTINPVANVWTPFSLTGTFPAGLKNAVIFIWTEGTFAQTNTLDIGLVQLESGSTASSFEYRHFGMELALAQRYYWSSFPTGVLPVYGVQANKIQFCGSYESTGYYQPHHSQTWPVTMRATPTIQSYQTASTTANEYSSAAGSTYNWQFKTADCRGSSFMYSGNNSVSAVPWSFHLTADSDI